MDFQDFEEEFQNFYIEFLKKERDIKDIIEDNYKKLKQFQKEMVIDANSILMLRAYFNFIECYLAIDNKAEVRRYLQVALSNLSDSNKKKDDLKESEEEAEADTWESRDKKYKTSRIELLFGRFKLLTKDYGESIKKITNSIILYAEIYGPESIGLTSNYYYLSKFFIEGGINPKETEEDRLYTVRNIYLKIADIWKKYFLGEENAHYEGNLP